MGVNIDSVRQLLKQYDTIKIKNAVYNIQDSSTDKKIIELLELLSEVSWNYSLLNCYCNNNYHYIKHDNKEGFNNIPISNQVRLSSINRGFAHAYIEYSTYTRKGESILDNVSKTVCNKIDTSILHANKTGNIKIIAKYNCHEYILKTKDNSYIKLWISNAIEPYINPGIFIIDNVAGGVVQVEFSNGNKITLLNISESNITPEIPKCNKESDALFDVTNSQLSF